MQYSIILPTRNNIPGLRKALDAFERTSHDKACFEVLLAVDTDDVQGKLIEGLSASYTFPVHVYHTQPTDNFSDDYYNFLASKSKGANIWAFNDDAYILTDGWDRIISKTIKDSGKGSFYLVDIHDTTRDHNGEIWPCFPMISRAAVNVMGFFFYPQVRIWPADKVAYGLFNKIESVIDCAAVQVRHEHVQENDPSKSRLARIFIEDKKAGRLNVNITTEVMRLLLATNRELRGKNERASAWLWFKDAERCLHRWTQRVRERFAGGYKFRSQARYGLGSKKSPVTVSG